MDPRVGNGMLIMGWKYQFDCQLLPKDVILKTTSAVVGRWSGRNVFVDIVPASPDVSLNRLLEATLENHLSRMPELDDVYAFPVSDGLKLLMQDNRFMECTRGGSLILCFVNDPSAFAVLAENGFNQTPPNSEMVMVEVSYRPSRSIFFSEGKCIDLTVNKLGEEFLNRFELCELLLSEGSHLYVNYANSQYDPDIGVTSQDFLDVLQLLRVSFSLRFKE